jgi:hypothetical protein
MMSATFGSRFAATTRITNANRMTHLGDIFDDYFMIFIVFSAPILYVQIMFSCSNNQNGMN